MFKIGEKVVVKNVDLVGDVYRLGQILTIRNIHKPPVWKYFFEGHTQGLGEKHIRKLTKLDKALQ